jgi:tripeptide aminopeptidase
MVMNSLLERFLRYVAVDTRSSHGAGGFPSTAGQVDFARTLAGEMRALGMADARVDAHGYVMATIPATKGRESEPTIGFIAHLDTSPDVGGANVRPRVVENYDGGDIALGTLVLSPRDFPELAGVRGHTLVVTDGTTLLGADDKAGIAIIMTAAEHLITHPELSHGPIRIAFTPDEEVGRGTDFFDVAKFGASYAYTVDGGAEGELEYENFNAAAAHAEFGGRNFHPGYALGRMVNALHLAQKFDAMLPADQRPETTSGREGFYHLTALNGTVEAAAADYLLRDFTREGLEKRKQTLRDAAAATGAKLDISDTYQNMREVIDRHPQVVQRAIQAMRTAGVEPLVRPIRGGTDGARLSFMGLPCPNIFTGGANFHSVYEYCSLDSMARAVHVVVALTLADEA